MIVFLYKINYFLQENIQNKKSHMRGIFYLYLQCIICFVHPNPLIKLLLIRLESSQSWNNHNQHGELPQ